VYLCVCDACATARFCVCAPLFPPAAAVFVVTLANAKSPPFPPPPTPKTELAYRLGVVAETRCASLIDTYNACAKGRTVSMLWACRAAYAESQDCVRAYVNRANIDEMKRRWLAGGRQTSPDWAELLRGLVPDEDLPTASSPGGSAAR